MQVLFLIALILVDSIITAALTI